MSSVLFTARVGYSDFKEGADRIRRKELMALSQVQRIEGDAMSGKPKFSVLQPWAEPSLSKKRNGDRLGFPCPIHDGPAEEQQVNIKLAGFFALVALLFVLAEHLGRTPERTDTNLGPDSTALVNLTVSPQESPRSGARLYLRFRLSNRGSHSIFYPVSTATNIPIGQLVARTTLLSDWMSLSSTSAPRLPAVGEDIDPNLRWIEMPPGGWADGKFSDPGDWTGEHAYAVFLKPSRNADVVRILSEPYRSGWK
jgi:hypothetical protein